MRQIYPVQGPDLQLAPRASTGPLPTAVTEIARLYGNGVAGNSAGRPWLRANMIASFDGAVSINGRSGGLSGPADKMVFTILRSLADVILVGAGTARTEHYRPVQPSHIWTSLRGDGIPVPPIAVVTATLNLDSCQRLLTDAAPGAQTIVITTKTAPADRRAAIAQHARVIEAGQQQVDFGAAVRALADLGHRAILTEGGPMLLGELADAGLIDELCLSISPLLAAGTAGRIVASASAAAAPATPAVAAAQLSLKHVLTDADYLMCRYVRES